jgi:type I restriction enzyme S subunit
MTTRTVTLGSIAKIMSGGTPERTKPAYWNGDIPWVKTSQIQNCTINADCVDEWITQEGLEQSSARMIPKGAILMAMYGQGKTRGQVAILGIDATINQACAAILLKPEAHRDYIYQQLRYRYESIRALSNTGSQENLNAELIREIAFPLPPLEAQKNVAEALGEWDTAIQKSEQLIVAKERRLAHFRDRLLSDPEGASPVKLREVTQELTARNAKSLGREAIMAVTKQFGMRPMREETIAANIERYKIVPPRAFAYNPMRLNIGSIAMSPFDQEVLVSPDYVVFACEASRLLPSYLHHLRHSQKWKSHFELAGNGSVRVRIYYGDLGRFAFLLPPIDIQARLVRLLDAAALEIALLKKHADALRTQKRGLMQKLLTGQWRLGPSKGVPA